jgi:hypothetical protein
LSQAGDQASHYQKAELTEHTRENFVASSEKHIERTSSSQQQKEFEKRYPKNIYLVVYEYINIFVPTHNNSFC